jgi:hypothetical protein
LNRPVIFLKHVLHCRNTFLSFPVLQDQVVQAAGFVMLSWLSEFSPVPFFEVTG